MTRDTVVLLGRFIAALPEDRCCLKPQWQKSRLERHSACRVSDHGHGKHIPVLRTKAVLGDRLQRFYEYLMADAKDFVDDLKRRPEWQRSDQSAESRNPRSAMTTSGSSFAR